MRRRPPRPKMAAPAGGSVRDTPKLEYKLLRKFKVLNTNNIRPICHVDYNLVASSPQHGLVFVASPDGLLAVYGVAELLYSKADPSRVTVELPEEPTLIAVNCDGELLAVVTHGRKTSILIYNVKDFRNQDASPKLTVPRGSRASVYDMQWSPSMNETLAIHFDDRITLIHDGSDERHLYTNVTGIRCFGWSPSGTSLVVGHKDGTLSVYSSDLTYQKRVPAPAPPLFGRGSLHVKAVHWMSNNQFAVVYCKAFSEGRYYESAFTLISTPDGELLPRAEYVGRFDSVSSWPWYRLLEVKPWNMMLCASMRAGIKLPPDSDRGGSQAPIQLLSKVLREDDLYSLGVTLDRVNVLRQSSQTHLHNSTDETMTLLHVLTRTWDLATYTVGVRPSTPRVDTESSRPTLCLKPAAPEPALIYSNAPSAPCIDDAPEDLPPLAFHSVHGENIRISRDGSEARRVRSICGGVAFSARPVRVNEKVCIRLMEMSNNWHGVVGLGFTTHDPTTFSHALPKTARPNYTNKPGNWAKALSERFCEQDNVLYYYVNCAGDVHFGVNGEDKGLFLSGVDIRSPLWALVDVYGKCTAVQFADPRAPSQIRQPNQSPVKEERLISGMSALSVDDPLPQLRYRSPLMPLSLHRTKGRNVQFVKARGVAARIEAEVCQGYVFTALPMQPGQTIVVQILSTETACAGSLAIGLTSCDPATLRPCDLPNDAEQLLDRPEYWVVQKDAASGLRNGDELAVTLTLDGEVRVRRNRSSLVTVMHVDHTVRLWAFVDINGATRKVRMLSSQTAQTPPQQIRELAGSAQNINTSGGTVLADSLPPQNGGQKANQHMALPSAPCLELLQSNHLCSASQNSCNEQLQIPNERDRDEPSTSGAHPHQPVCAVIGEEQPPDPDCIICCENPKDSVLYMCGHTCMCYKCAVDQWKGQGDGQCPLCRAQIKDVIRMYV